MGSFWDPLFEGGGPFPWGLLRGEAQRGSKKGSKKGSKRGPKRGHFGVILGGPKRGPKSVHLDCKWVWEAQIWAIYPQNTPFLGHIWAIYGVWEGVYILNAHKLDPSGRPPKYPILTHFGGIWGSKKGSNLCAFHC